MPALVDPAALMSGRRRMQQGAVWAGTTNQDLWDEYANIFTVGNRNAASHLWATFVLDRAWQMAEGTVTDLFASFCPVSGSPVRASSNNRYRVTLDASHVDETTQQRTGYLHYCCWP